jgi:hypothetical protein
MTILSGSLLLAATTAVVPNPAWAAAGEFGNGCTAVSAPSNVTIVMTNGAATNPIPVAAPATGVITKARFAMPTVPTPYPQKLKVVRATGTINQYTVVTESAALNVSGTQSFDVRLPVTAGDLLGLYGTIGTLACSSPDPGDVVAALGGDSAPGSTATYSPSAGVALPVVATVEPDIDKDGYGDVTQDLCPQSPAFQSECPVVVLDSFAAPQGGKIIVVVATDNEAKVKVTGKATVNGKKIKLKSGAKTVKPGKLAQFKVQLPKPLRDALAALPRSKFIKVTLVATSTDIVGRKAKDKTSVKLYGTR